VELDLLASLEERLRRELAAEEVRGSPDPQLAGDASED
jgi:hypothetical protein